MRLSAARILISPKTAVEESFAPRAVLAKKKAKMVRARDAIATERRQSRTCTDQKGIDSRHPSMHGGIPVYELRDTSTDIFLSAIFIDHGTWCPNRHIYPVLCFG